MAIHNCKNCGTELAVTDEYCRNCGAKIIRNRLSFKNLFEHISETFFNYDNKLLRTIIDLFKKPEAVIIGYISGIRKRYVNPISFLGIALTLSGLSLFIMKRANFKVDFDVFNQGLNQSYMTKIQTFTNEYSSFIYLSFIPLFAISSWLFLRVKNFNFTERIVTFIYAFAQYSLSIFLPSVVMTLFFPDFYMTFSFISLLFLIAYAVWVLYKITKLKGIELISQTVVFLSFFGMLYLFHSLMMLVLFLLSGEITIQDFVPQKQNQTSSVLIDYVYQLLC